MHTQHRLRVWCAGVASGPDKGWPYRAMQFKIPVTGSAGFHDDGAVNPHGGR